MLVRIFSLVWQAPVIRYPESVITPLTIPVTPEHPRGWKGACLRMAWHLTKGMPGFLVVDSDTAIDASDIVRMQRRIMSDPTAAWTALCRCGGRGLTHPELRTIPPDLRSLVSMNPDNHWVGDDAAVLNPRPAGAWAHKTKSADGAYHWGRSSDDEIAVLGFGFSYLPHALMQRLEDSGRWGEIQHPDDDRLLSLVAQEEPAIRMRLASDVYARHVHFGAQDVLDMWREGVPE